MDVEKGGISERKVRTRECVEKGGFGVETKGAESKGGYDENASTLNITDSAIRENENHCTRIGSLGKCQTKSKGLQRLSETLSAPGTPDN